LRWSRLQIHTWRTTFTQNPGSEAVIATGVNDRFIRGGGGELYGAEGRRGTIVDDGGSDDRGGGGKIGGGRVRGGRGGAVEGRQLWLIKIYLLE